MTAVANAVVVPAEAWHFFDRFGLREVFEAYLSSAGAFYGPTRSMVIRYDPCDPTFEDEQMTLQVEALPGGRAGWDTDLEWMRLARERFGPILMSRVTPNSSFATPDSANE